MILAVVVNVVPVRSSSHHHHHHHHHRGKLGKAPITGAQRSHDIGSWAALALALSRGVQVKL